MLAARDGIGHDHDKRANDASAVRKASDMREFEAPSRTLGDLSADMAGKLARQCPSLPVFAVTLALPICTVTSAPGLAAP